MTNRRMFLKNSAVLSGGLLVGGDVFMIRKKEQIGTQLYTVRNEMAKDPAGTLAKIAAIGYKLVEASSYTGTELFYGMSPLKFKNTLSELGLDMPSAHYILGESMSSVKGTLTNDWQKAVDDAAAINLKYMVCSFLFPAERGDLDHFKRTAEKLNKAGELSKTAGIQLCYHNHDFEFEAQGNKIPFDVILSNTDPDLVKIEMDIYWVYKAKKNPIDLFKKYPGRFPLWHVKDMDDTPQQNFTEVGNGVIPFREIFKYADQSGMKYYFNEQDQTPGDPIISMTKSFDYIKKNL